MRNPFELRCVARVGCRPAVSRDVERRHDRRQEVRLHRDHQNVVRNSARPHPTTLPLGSSHTWLEPARVGSCGCVEAEGEGEIERKKARERHPPRSEPLTRGWKQRCVVPDAQPVPAHRPRVGGAERAEYRSRSFFLSISLSLPLALSSLLALSLSRFIPLSRMAWGWGWEGGTDLLEGRGELVGRRVREVVDDGGVEDVSPLPEPQSLSGPERASECPKIPW